MPEIGTSGLMSEDGKRSVATWPKPPRLSSTLLRHAIGDLFLTRCATREWSLRRGRASHSATRQTTRHIALAGPARLRTTVAAPAPEPVGLLMVSWSPEIV
jgi:hypothetical protein